MGRARGRLGLAAAAMAALLLAGAMALPWWSVARESGGDVETDERQAPFRRSDASAGDHYQQQVILLGFLAAGAAILNIAATAIVASHLRAPGAGSRMAWQAAAAATSLAALAYLFFAFPAEANAARGRTDLTFWGRECSRVLTVEICIVTRPLLGFWLAVGGAGLSVASLGLVGLGLPVRQRRPAAVRMPPTVPLPASARTPLAGAPGRTTRIVKCPQCQTKMAFSASGPAERDCANCGRRVRG